MLELTAIKFETLPLQNAIAIKKGDGSYRFAVFTDPDCPHCRYLEQSLEKSSLSDYISYVFMLPLEELHPQAREKCEAIWGAPDKAAAWLDWMINQKLPGKFEGKTPIDDNLKLAEDLGLMGTPTIYLSDGTQTSQQGLLKVLGDKDK